MTPNHLDILLHYNRINAPHPRDTAKAVAEHTEELMSMGLLMRDISLEGGCSITTLGRAHVMQLCDLAIPRLVYLGADGEVINL